MKGRFSRSVVWWKEAEDLASYFAEEAFLYIRERNYNPITPGYPWRRRGDPYSIFVAEFLLRKTTAKQVVSVYEQFLTRYPDFRSLASAETSEIMDIVAPLGLRSRAFCLKRASEYVCIKYGGELPRDKDLLLAIPYVGPYIAGAILSFSFGLPEPIVDTGIARFWRRFVLGAVHLRKNLHRDPLAWLASEVFIKRFAGEKRVGNYFLLDFVLDNCKSKPRCSTCFVRSQCRVWVAPSNL